MNLNDLKEFVNETKVPESPPDQRSRNKPFIVIDFMTVLLTSYSIISVLPVINHSSSFIQWYYCG